MSYFESVLRNRGVLLFATLASIASLATGCGDAGSDPLSIEAGETRVEAAERREQAEEPADVPRAGAEKSEPADLEGPAVREEVDLDTWPTFRGDARLSGYRDVSIAERPKLLWSYDSGATITSTAAIVGGKVWVGTQEGHLLALDLQTSEPVERAGKLLWKYESEGAPIQSSPGVADGKVYFGDDYGIFHAVDAETGKKVWSRDTEGMEIISSAVFHGDSVLFGGYDNFIWALDRKSGKVRWKIETGGPVHGTLAIADGRTYASGCDALLHIIDIEAQKEEASIELPDYSAASPSVVGDRLFLGLNSGSVFGIDWKERKVAWTYTHPKRVFPYSSSAAVHGGRLYVGGEDKMLHCLDQATGEEIWSFPTRARIECSPVVARDRVIFGSGDKNLYVLSAGEGREVWRFEGDGAFAASPALAQGRLVISSDAGVVYCFDVRPAAAGDASQ